MKEKGRDRRLRTGCLICKLRHVKCGEERPSCKNCREANRQCMGYPPPSAPPTVASPSSSSSSSSTTPSEQSQTELQITKAPTRSIASRPQWSQKEIRSFSFGLHKTLPNLTTYFESEFWNKQIPRLAQNEPAVRHALNALAAFHEKSNQHDAMVEAKGKSSDSQLVSGSVDKFFLQQYTKAISELRQQMSGNDHQAVISTLVCCCIFMCIEGLHGRHLAMVNHITNGLKVYHEWIRRIKPSERFGASSIEAGVFGTFRRIDFHAATFVDGHVPEPHTLNIIQLPPPVDDFNPKFLSIEHARNHVDSLYGRTFIFLRVYEGTKFGNLELEQIPQEIREKHRIVGIWLHVCSIALDDFSRNNNIEESRMGKRSMTLLKMRIKAISVLHRRWPHEKAPHEECELELQSVFDLAKSLLMSHIAALLTPEDSDASGSSPDNITDEPPTEGSPLIFSTSRPSFADPPIFTIETGIVPIAYYIAITTLSLSLRRDAISLLRTANLREGLWSSTRTADMAETRIAANDGKPCPMTGAEMGALTKTLWEELRLEEMTEGWGIS